MTKRYMEKYTKFENMYILLAMWSRVKKNRKEERKKRKLPTAVVLTREDEGLPRAVGT